MNVRSLTSTQLVWPIYNYIYDEVFYQITKQVRNPSTSQAYNALYFSIMHQINRQIEDQIYEHFNRPIGEST